VPEHLGDGFGHRVRARPAPVGTMCGVDDRVAHFLVSVGKLCADAHVGGLTVRLVLDNGEEVVGVTAPPPESEGPDELDSTGYVDCLWIGGVAVPLSEVAEAAIYRPALA
jgi:hypothetical protein